MTAVDGARQALPGAGMQQDEMVQALLDPCRQTSLSSQMSKGAVLNRVTSDGT